MVMEVECSSLLELLFSRAIETLDIAQSFVSYPPFLGSITDNVFLKWLRKSYGVGRGCLRSQFDGH